MQIPRDEIKAANLNDIEQIRSLLMDLAQDFADKDDFISHLETEIRDLYALNAIKDDRILKLEQYSSKMCLIFLGIRTSDDPLSSILGLIQQFMRINNSAEDIAACHHLPSANMNKPVIVKFIYKNQRDRIWQNRASLKNYGPTKKVYIVERLADHDKHVIEPCKQVNVEYVANNFQPMVRVEGVLKKVDSKNDVDMILQNGSFDKDVEMHVYSGSTQGDSFAGSKSNTTFPTSGEKGKTLSKIYVGKRKYDKDDNKLDRLCSLLETVIEHVSPPAKNSIGSMWTAVYYK